MFALKQSDFCMFFQSLQHRARYSKKQSLNTVSENRTSTLAVGSGFEEGPGLKGGLG